MSYLLLFGGSFNPPHCGHMRIAIESMEALRPERLLFIPTAHPPHKPARGLLPFAMRCAMLEAAIADMRGPSGMAVSGLEQERAGPSYTIETLRILAAREPGLRLLFLLGSDDYLKLPTWKDWQDFGRYADLLVLPRRELTDQGFMEASLKLWPGARSEAGPVPGVSVAMRLPGGTGEAEGAARAEGAGGAEKQGGGRCFLLPQPVLDISATLVRQRFLQGRRLDFLAPPAVVAYMAGHDHAIRSIWNQSP